MKREKYREKMYIVKRPRCVIPWSLFASSLSFIPFNPHIDSPISLYPPLFPLSIFLLPLLFSNSLLSPIQPPTCTYDPLEKFTPLCLSIYYCSIHHPKKQPLAVFLFLFFSSTARLCVSHTRAQGVGVL